MFLSNKIHRIIEDANKVFEGDALHSDRKLGNVAARKAVGYYFHRVMGFSCTRAGEFINKDHATVLHYCREHLNDLKYNKEYRAKYNEFFKMQSPEKPKRWLCFEAMFEVKRSKV